MSAGAFKGIVDNQKLYSSYFVIFNEYNQAVNVLLTQGTDNWREVLPALKAYGERVVSLGSKVMLRRQLQPTSRPVCFPFECLHWPSASAGAVDLGLALCLQVEVAYTDNAAAAQHLLLEPIPSLRPEEGGHGVKQVPMLSLGCSSVCSMSCLLSRFVSHSQHSSLCLSPAI